MDSAGPRNRGGRPGKGDRVFVPARAPKALVDHVVRTAEAQGLTQNAYLCTLLEDLHGYARSEVSQIEAVDIVRLSRIPHTTAGAKLRCRLKRELVQHIDRVASQQGMERAPYVAALVAQEHGFDVDRPVSPQPYVPEYVADVFPEMDLAPTGT